MGYTTDFAGQFNIDKKLDSDTHTLLKGLATTRRMKRRVDDKYGVEGEFYVDGKGWAGQDRDDTVIDYNCPPETQPGLWCQWLVNNEGTAIAWDGGEKFYNYVQWIEYIIDRILAPRNYKLNGSVLWRGEDPGDKGVIDIVDNQVKAVPL